MPRLGVQISSVAPILGNTKMNSNGLYVSGLLYVLNNAILYMEGQAKFCPSNPIKECILDLTKEVKECIIRFNEKHGDIIHNKL